MTNRKISDKNNEQLLNFWEALKMDTKKDYHGLCLKVNVLLLVCVFETFRKYIFFELDRFIFSYLLSTKLHP